MNRETFLKPVLCIDLKKNRIRIHKLTLHMLGDPEYIQLLVNPQDSMIAIRKSVRKDYLAHRVRYSKAVTVTNYTVRNFYRHYGIRAYIWRTTAATVSTVH